MWPLLLVLVPLAAWLIAAAAPASVRTATVRRDDLVGTFVCTGVVEGRHVQVAPSVLGRLEAVLVQEGDRVRRGQLLARIDAQQAMAGVGQAKAALARARERWMQARHQLARQETEDRFAVRQRRAQVEAARWNLARLEHGPRAEEIEAQQARVREASHRLDFARSRAARQQELFARGFVSRERWEAAQHEADLARVHHDEAAAVLQQLQRGTRAEDLHQARAQVDESAAALDLARAGASRLSMLQAEVDAAEAVLAEQRAELEAARAVLARHEIRAPLDGVVSQKLAEAGDMATPGRPILALVDGSAPSVRADVDQEDAGLVRVGQAVRVTCAAAPGRVIAGQVVTVGPAVERKRDSTSDSRVLRVKVRLTADAGLIPGMEVNVEGSRPLQARALLVPREAVLRERGRCYVWRVDQGRVARSEVTLGAENFDMAVVSAGLREGEQVVVGGLEALRDGDGVSAAP